MTDLNHIHMGLPLEREYEAWITSGIDDYLRRHDVPHTIFAISPQKERHWPGDIAGLVDGKLLGFQFKRPKSKASSSSLNDIYWQVGSPTHQYGGIQRREHILYALPTFLNRRSHPNALWHCLFWRPHAKKHYFRVWYGKTRGHTNDLSHIETRKRAYRWGRLFERLSACEVGLRLTNPEQTHTALHDLKTLSLRAQVEEEPDAVTGTLYALWIGKLPEEKL